jgi:hypothetical protein
MSTSREAEFDTADDDAANGDDNEFEQAGDLDAPGRLSRRSA